MAKSMSIGIGSGIGTSSTRRSLKRSVTSILISFSAARLNTSCSRHRETGQR